MEMLRCCWSDGRKATSFDILGAGVATAGVCMRPDDAIVLEVATWGLPGEICCRLTAVW